MKRITFGVILALTAMAAVQGCGVKTEEISVSPNPTESVMVSEQVEAVKESSFEDIIASFEQKMLEEGSKENADIIEECEIEPHIYNQAFINTKAGRVYHFTVNTWPNGEGDTSYIVKDAEDGIKILYEYESWARNRFNIYDGGYIQNCGSDGAAYHNEDLYVLEESIKKVYSFRTTFLYELFEYPRSGEEIFAGLSEILKDVGVPETVMRRTLLYKLSVGDKDIWFMDFYHADEVAFKEQIFKTIASSEFANRIIPCTDEEEFVGRWKSMVEDFGIDMDALLKVEPIVGEKEFEMEYLLKEAKRNKKEESTISDFSVTFEEISRIRETIKEFSAKVDPSLFKDYYCAITDLNQNGRPEIIFTANIGIEHNSLLSIYEMPSDNGPAQIIKEFEFNMEKESERAPDFLYEEKIKGIFIEKTGSYKYYISDLLRSGSFLEHVDLMELTFGKENKIRSVFCIENEMTESGYTVSYYYDSSKREIGKEAYERQLSDLEGSYNISHKLNWFRLDSLSPNDELMDKQLVYYYNPKDFEYMTAK